MNNTMITLHMLKDGSQVIIDPGRIQSIDAPIGGDMNAPGSRVITRGKEGIVYDTIVRESFLEISDIVFLAKEKDPQSAATL